MAIVETTRGFVGHAEQMLQSHPGPPGLNRAALLDCVHACFDCMQACITCADACLAEVDPKAQVRCIRLNLDCADVCEATGKILSRQTAFHPSMANALLRACIAACKLCADECDRHAGAMEHCRVCAEACRQCERMCIRLLPHRDEQNLEDRAL